jgi:hypothetical protein
MFWYLKQLKNLEQIYLILKIYGLISKMKIAYQQRFLNILILKLSIQKLYHNVFINFKLVLLFITQYIRILSKMYLNNN